MLINEEDGKRTICSLEDALAKAKSNNLDLVLIDASQKTPVCKIFDYGKYSYSKTKKEKLQKRVNKDTNQVSGMRLTSTISRNDLESKVKIVKKHLLQGNKIKVEVRAKGRQRMYPERAEMTLRRFYEMLSDIAQMEGEISKEMSGARVVLSLKKNKVTQTKQL